MSFLEWMKAKDLQNESFPRNWDINVQYYDPRKEQEEDEKIDALGRQKDKERQDAILAKIRSMTPEDKAKFQQQNAEHAWRIWANVNLSPEEYRKIENNRKYGAGIKGFFNRMIGRTLPYQAPPHPGL